MPSELNRPAFEKMIAEDIAWLKAQPGGDGPSTEKGHILLLLKHVSVLYYDNAAVREELRTRLGDTLKALRAITAAWEDGDLSAKESGAKMVDIARAALEAEAKIEAGNNEPDSVPPGS